MLTKTQLKEILVKNNIRLKKSLGQNFLIDKNIKDKIIKKACIKKDEFILEIGSGLGALTEDLTKGCCAVYAVEKDKILSKILKKMLSEYKNLTIIEENILKFDVNKIPSSDIKVIGNLPYYITTPIIFCLLQKRKRIKSIFVTVQKEMAARITAGPGSKDYSPLSLRVQFYTEPAIEMGIKENAFFPQPEVSSSLVSLKVRRRPPVSVKSEENLFKIIRSSFNQRRKTLLKALSSAGNLGLDRRGIRSVLDSAGIDPKRRAETLSLEEFSRISDAIDNFV